MHSFDCIVSMISYGSGALIIENDTQLTMDSIDPSLWFPMGGDRQAIASLVTSMDGSGDTPNIIEIRVIEPNNESTTYRHRYEGDATNGIIGTFIESYESPDAMVVQTIKRPRGDQWGTSLYPDILTLVMELANRFTRTSSILDQHEKPTVIIWQDEQDTNDLAGLMGKDTGTSPEAVLGRKDAVVADLTKQFDGDIVLMDNAKQKAEYLVWNGQLIASARQIQDIKQEITTITGMNDLLIQGKGIPSGVALRRILLPLYARVQTLQNELIPVVQSMIRSFTGEQVTVTWPNPLDILDDTQPSDNNENLPATREGDDDDA